MSNGVKVMRETTFTSTDSHLFSPMSAFLGDSRSHFISLRFKVDKTLQINTSSFLILNNKIVLIKVVKNHNFLVLYNKSFEYAYHA